MHSVRRLVCWVAVLGVGAWASTTVSLGTYEVEQGSAVAVRVTVTCPLLKELQVWVECDPAALQVDPASLWVNPARLYNAYDPGAAVVPATFMATTPGSGLVMFWLQSSAEVGDSGWRVRAAAEGDSESAVFGFSIQGLTQGTHSLSFYAASPPFARNMDVFYPYEPVAAVPGSVLVYRPAGPVVFSPPGGSYNHAIEVTLSSEFATRVVYTLDGSTPDADSPEVPPGQALYLDGTDGQVIPLRALAFGVAGSPAAGTASFRFDMTVPVVTVTPLTTAAGKPTLHGTVSEAGTGVEVTVSGVTAAAVNDGIGGWSLDLSSVLGGDLPEGVYDVAVAATDAAGNRGTDGTVAELTVDRTPPQGGFVVGEGNPAYVAGVATTLIASVSGASEMRFRNSGEDWLPWAAYAPTVSWLLMETDGTKTVLGEFRDTAGNVLAKADSVGLDTSPPLSGITTAGVYGPLTWPGEIAGTGSDSLSGVVRVEVRCLRSDTSESWTGSGWSASETWLVASGTSTWSLELDAALLPVETTITAHSRAVDGAGNVQSTLASSTFAYDDTAPVGAFSIESAGVVAVRVRPVTLDCSVSGAAQMRFREGAAAWTAWLPFASSYPWTLSDGDGQKVLQAAFRDMAGNLLELSDGVLLDRVAPVTHISTAGGYGPSSWAGMVSGTVADGTSGAAAVAVSVLRQPVGKATAEYWDGVSWVASEQWLTANLTGAAWSVPLATAALEEGGDGRSYRVAARSQDYAGNVETPTVEADFLFDSSIPAGGFSIGTGNPLYLNAVSVTLFCGVAATHPLEMRFRNDGGSFPGAWTAYAATLPWVLPTGNGLKTVYGEFRDTVTGTILATSDTVTLDTDVPGSTLGTVGAFSPVTWPGSIVGTASDDGPAGVERVEVTILRNDGQYWYGSGWQPVEARLSVDVTAGVWAQAFPAAFLSDGGTYFLSSRAADRAGNLQTNAATAVVSYDSSAPGGSFTIGVGNPMATAAREVTLAIAVTGATEMAFRNGGGAWSAWEPAASTRPQWQLIGGDGTKQVSGRFRDAVGNVFETEDSILYDSTVPTSTLSVAGAYGPLSWPGGVAGTASDALSGVARVEVRVQRGSDGAFWSGSAWGGSEVWLAASGSVSWDVPLASTQLLSGDRYSVSSRAVDNAGNEQSPVADASFLFDAGLPSSSISTAALVGAATWPGWVQGTATDALTDVATVSVRLRRLLGGEVSYWNGSDWELDNDTLWLTATGTQVWRLTVPLAGLTHNANYTAWSRAVDAVGNVQSPLASRAFVYDGVAPDVPTLTGITTDSGVVGDLITSDRTLVFSGQAEAGCTVEMRLGGVIIGSVPSDAGGAWTMDHSGTALAAGSQTIELAATDAGGNRSSWSSPLTLSIDTVAPVLTCALVSGVSLNGSATLTFTSDGLGPVEASCDQAQWTAVQSGVSVLAGVAGFSGLSQGAFTLYLRDSDVAGNVGRVQVTLNKDTVAPTGYALAINQAHINTANRQALTFTLTGAEVGTVCEYSIAGAGRTEVAGSFGVLTATQISPAISVDALADGLLTVTGLLRDAAGNAGAPVTDEVEKDTVAPSGYAVHVEPASINAANATLFTFQVSAAEVGAVCHYSVRSAGGGSPVAGSVTVAAETFSLGPLDVSALPDALLTLTVYLTDPSGNTGLTVSDSVPKDVLVPPVPVVETWTQPVNQDTAAAFACGGQAEAAATVLYRLVSSAGVATVEGSVVAALDGRFSISGIDVTSLVDGTLTLSVAARDLAGNQSPYGGERTALKDTVAPVVTLALPPVSSRVNGSETITVTTGGVGAVAASFDQAQWTAVLSGVSTLAEVAGFGDLPEGDFSLHLRDSDVAGNVGRTEAALVKDTLPPTGYTVSIDQPQISVANRLALTFSLAAAEIGSLCEYEVTSAGRTAVSGNFSVAAATQVSPAIAVDGLDDGVLTVAVRLRDEAGNVGAVVSDQVEKDTTAPAGHSVQVEPAYINAGNQTQFTFQLSDAEVGAVCEYTVQSAVPGPAVVGSATVAAATSSLGPLDVSALPDAMLTLTVVLTDPFGNAGLPVSDQVLKDVQPPAAPVLGSVATVINAGSLAEFGFAGTGEAGTTIVYSLAPLARAGELSGTLPVSGGGTFALSGLDTAALPDGSLLLHILARDAAGNVSGEVHSAPIVKDTVFPDVTLASPVPSGRVNGDEVFLFTASEPVVARASLDGVTWLDLVSGTSVLRDLASFEAFGDVLFTITLRAADAAGNVTAYNYDLTKDTVVPSGYAVAFDEAFVDVSLTGEVTFTISDGEPGSAFSYEIRDGLGGRGLVSGAGTVTLSPQQVSGVSVAGLAQGSLTLRLRLTDTAGNTGADVFSETTLGTSQILTLTYGWNAVGVTVAPVVSVADILAEASGRADGALIRGAFSGYRGGVPVVLSGMDALAFASAYRVFASRPGTVRVRGVAGTGLGSLPSGWTYAAPAADMARADLPAAWSVWADAEPGRAYRPLPADSLLQAGTPVWILVVP